MSIRREIAAHCWKGFLPSGSEHHLGQPARPEATVTFAACDLAQRRDTLERLVPVAAPGVLLLPGVWIGFERLDRSWGRSQGTGSGGRSVSDRAGRAGAARHGDGGGHRRPGRRVCEGCDPGRPMPGRAGGGRVGLDSR